MELLTVVPFPSAPWALSPQQYAVPMMLTAQVCRPPAETAANAISAEGSVTATVASASQASPPAVSLPETDTVHRKTPGTAPAVKRPVLVMVPPPTRISQPGE